MLQPADGQTCGEYLSSYIAATGTGYVVNSDATSNCEFCAMSTTNAFLKAVSLNYDLRWRNLGIFIAYIFINVALATFLYWLARVPKKSSRVKNENEHQSANKSNSEVDEKTSESGSA